MAPFGGKNACALLEIVVERFEHCGVKFPAVKEKVGFKVVVEAAEIEVCGAYADEFVVDEQGLGMKHACFVEIYLYSCTQTFRNIRCRGIGEHHGIAAARYHYPYVDVCERRCLKCFQERFGRQEIGRLYVYPAGGTGDGFVEGKGDIGPLGCRTGGEQLDAYTVDFSRKRSEAGGLPRRKVFDKLSAGEVPRIAGSFGVDTTTKANITSAVYTAQAAVNTTRTIAAAIK